MTALVHNEDFSAVRREIESHPAWCGRVSGLKAEKRLRGWNHPFLYLLRGGETATETEIDYYISFVLPDGTIRHQPIVITLAPEGWYYENFVPGGPFSSTVSINDVLHLIMHCEKGEPTPFVAG